MRLKRKKVFIHTNQPLITSFYIKKLLIFWPISDESALIYSFLRNGRVRVEITKIIGGIVQLYLIFSVSWRHISNFTGLINSELQIPDNIIF